MCACMRVCARVVNLFTYPVGCHGSSGTVFLQDRPPVPDRHCHPSGAPLCCACVCVYLETEIETEIGVWH